MSDSQETNSDEEALPIALLIAIGGMVVGYLLYLKLPDVIPPVVKVAILITGYVIILTIGLVVKKQLDPTDPMARAKRINWHHRQQAPTMRTPPGRLGHCARSAGTAAATVAHAVTARLAAATPSTDTNDDDDENHQ